MQSAIDDKLYQLQMATNKYKNIDCLSDYVLFAIARYIQTDRATNEFIKSFIAFDSNKFPELIKKCLNGDRSDSGIIKTCKAVLAKCNR